MGTRWLPLVLVLYLQPMCSSLLMLHSLPILLFYLLSLSPISIVIKVLLCFFHKACMLIPKFPLPHLPPFTQISQMYQCPLKRKLLYQGGRLGLQIDHLLLLIPILRGVPIKDNPRMTPERLKDQKSLKFLTIRLTVSHQEFWELIPCFLGGLRELIPRLLRALRGPLVLRRFPMGRALL